MDQQICRLCLTTLDSFLILEDNLRANLEDFLSKSVLNFSRRQNVICNECRNNLQVLYNFKRTFIDIRDKTLQMADCKSKASMDMEDIENKHIKWAVKSPMTCNFCTEIVGKLCFISLEELKKYTSLVNIPQEHNLELNSNSSEKIISCESCSNSWQGLQSFLINCVNLEEKIRKYAEEEGTDNCGKIDLRMVREFTSKSTLQQDIGCCNAFKAEAIDGEQELFIKSEPELKCENEDDLQLLIKHEEVHIKSEENDSDKFHGNTEQPISTHRDPSETQMYKCREFAFGTINAKSMKQDMVTHKDPSDCTMHECDRPVYKCEICSYETIQRNLLKRHMIKHKDPSERENYKCKNCTYETKCKSALWRHSMIHKDPSEINIFKCDVCTYESKFKALSRQSITLHKLIHLHPVDVSMLKCKMCTFETKQRSALELHMVTHMGPSKRKKYKCRECAYETVNKHYLHRHRYIHSNPARKKTYKCKVCPFEANYIENTRQHMLTHKDPSERKTYKCKEDCLYQTISKESMVRHTLTHNDPSAVKLLKCEICEYETIYIQNMRRHILTHKNPSERKKQKCKHCAYEVLHGKSLKKHLLTHKDPSEITIHRCELCAYETKHIADFKRHMRTKTHKNSAATRKESKSTTTTANGKLS